MRNSDWSSNVCFSDLAPGDAPGYSNGSPAHPIPPEACADNDADTRRAAPGERAARNRPTPYALARSPPAHRRRPLPETRHRTPCLERKSVVEGKSVSVRVDLGSRRICKKKTQKVI